MSTAHTRPLDWSAVQGLEPHDAGARDGFAFGSAVLPEELSAYYQENDESQYGALRAAALFYMRNRGIDRHDYVDAFRSRAESVIGARMAEAIVQIWNPDYRFPGRTWGKQANT